MLASNGAREACGSGQPRTQADRSNSGAIRADLLLALRYTWDNASVCPTYQASAAPRLLQTRVSQRSPLGASTQGFVRRSSADSGFLSCSLSAAGAQKKNPRGTVMNASRSHAAACAATPGGSSGKPKLLGAQTMNVLRPASERNAKTWKNRSSTSASRIGLRQLSARCPRRYRSNPRNRNGEPDVADAASFPIGVSMLSAKY